MRERERETEKYCCNWSRGKQISRSATQTHTQAGERERASPPSICSYEKKTLPVLSRKGKNALAVLIRAADCGQCPLWHTLTRDCPSATISSTKSPKIHGKCTLLLSGRNMTQTNT